MTTAVVTVTRTELGLAPLAISASPYGIGDDGSADLGMVTWRRTHARSPYMHGAVLVGATKDLVEGCTLDVDVTGVDQTAVKTAADALVAAFEQWSYTLTITLDGVGRAWDCEPADWLQGYIEPSNLYGFIMPVRLVFNRSPLAGTPTTAPGAPTIGTATGGNASATANWTAPASNGGAAVTGYEVKTYRASDNVLLHTDTVGVVLTFNKTGLTNGVGVYFKVAAINVVGTGSQSAASNTVTPAPTVPPAPTIGTLVAGNDLVTAHWTDNGDGGSPLTAVRIRVYRASDNVFQTMTEYTASVTSPKTALAGEGVAVYVRVTLVNAIGAGPESANSNTVTPT